jgi:hypothetical protein
MQTRRTARSAVRDRIDAADQAIMARLSAESSPVLDRFLPALSRSADFFVLWIGIAAALAASNDERGRRAAVRGLAGMRSRRDGVARRMTAPAYALSSSGVFVPGA